MHLAILLLRLALLRACSSRRFSCPMEPDQCCLLQSAARTSRRTEARAPVRHRVARRAHIQLENTALNIPIASRTTAPTSRM
jgi:hypothetical protein